MLYNPSSNVDGDLFLMSKNVLIVEDYDDSRFLLAFLLKREGYHVIEAVDGYEAVQTAQSEHPDIILMDISLSVMDDITATSQIKSNLDTEDIPIIGITAHGPLYIKAAAHAGFSEVMEKPVEFDVLKAKMRGYLSN